MKNHCKSPHILAFTLAEVLIILLVIGVVAALTIPTLISNYQKEQTVIQLKKAYTVTEQAIKRSEVENDSYSSWDYTTGAFTVAGTRSFMNKYLTPYLSNISECSVGNNTTCGHPVSGNGVNYLLPDGVELAVVLQSAQRFFIVLDINGPKSPNIMGKDAFYFILTPSGGLLPAYYSKGMTRAQIINNGAYHCAVANKTMCTALIMFDGWKISDDYPW